MQLHYDVAVIGADRRDWLRLGGPRPGAERVMLIDRDRELGGILQQCIHNGFGLHLFNEELTGPEYAYKFIRRTLPGVEFSTHVPRCNPVATFMHQQKLGMVDIAAGAVVLAMGCRERNRGR